MALTLAYRTQLAAQFIESFVTFIYKKRKVAELLAKGELTVAEASILTHYQRDITHDRGIFALWRNLMVNNGYTLAQIKTFILSHRASILAILRNKWIAEMTQIDVLRDETMASAQSEDEIANLPALLAELDVRKSKRQMWHDLVVELRDKPEVDFASEAEMTS